MVERGKNAASEKKRKIGRAGTKHLPEYSPPRRFKPLKPGLLPLNSYFKTVITFTRLIALHSFLQFLYNARIQNTWKDNVYGKLDLQGRIAGSYRVQRLVIEPCVNLAPGGG